MFIKLSDYRTQSKGEKQQLADFFHSETNRLWLVVRTLSESVMSAP